MADNIFHSFYVVLGYSQTRASGGLQVDHELSGISPRKEGKTEQRIERQACDENAHKTIDDSLRMLQRDFYPLFVSIQHTFKMLIEGLVKTSGDPSARGDSFVSLILQGPQDARAIEWNHGHRDKVRCN